MLALLALFQDLLTTCYLTKTKVILDVNTNLLEISLVRNDTIDLLCQHIDKGVKVNVTINSPKNNLVPLITATVNNFSYLLTNKIFILNALDPIVEFNVIYYVRIDIYTYGKILSIQTSNFLKQRSNLEACYSDNSVGNMFKDRIEITLTPTGICALQMQTKSIGLTNYLESINFQMNSLNIKYDIVNFDYSQTQQTLIFYNNLLDTIIDTPFLSGNIIFNSNQGGTVISFSHEILDMRLNTVPDFFTSGQVGMWNSKFYIKLQYNQSLYQKYLAIKGFETTFKLSIELDSVVYSFSRIYNENILQNQYVEIDCNQQVIQTKQQCQKLIVDQQYDKLNLNIISRQQDSILSSTFNIPLQMIQTCWNRAFAVRQNSQFQINLYGNHICNIQHGQLSLFNIENEIILNDIFNNYTYYQIYKVEPHSKLYTVVVKSNSEQYSIVIDQIKQFSIDYTKIVTITLGSCFIIYSIAFFISGLINILNALKRMKQKKQKKL